MSTSISGAVAGQGHMAKRIDQINTYWWNHNLYFSRLTLVCLCSYLIQGITDLVVIFQQFPIRINRIKRKLNTSSWSHGWEDSAWILCSKHWEHLHWTNNLKFELKPSLINMVQATPFSEKAHEDASAHLQHFLEISSIVVIKDVAQDIILLCLFPFSLVGWAK